MSSNLMGVVLSGGQSSRMGQEKSQLEHPQGGTFLQLAIKRLKDICQDVCVAGAPPDADGEEATLVDPVPYLGPIVGIVNSLGFAKRKHHDACLVTPVDMPNLTTDDLRQLVYAWRDHGQMTIGIQETDQTLQPLVAIYNVSQHAELTRLAESEDRSLSRWIEQQPFQRVPLSARSCHNVNQPQDLTLGDLNFGALKSDDSEPA